MEKSEIKGFIAKRCAKELKNGDVVNLGIGLPTLIPNYLPKDVELIIHAELGIVSAGATPKEGDANYDPYHVIDAGGGVASVAYGGGFIDSATNFGLIRGRSGGGCSGQPGQLDHPRQEDARHGRRYGPVRGC